MSDFSPEMQARVATMIASVDRSIDEIRARVIRLEETQTAITPDPSEAPA